jgi:arginyl-tRNA synthetase
MATMILPIHEQLRARLAEAIRRLYGVDVTTLPAGTVPIDYTPTRDLGDLAIPVAFELARRVRKPPRLIAQALGAELGSVPGVASLEATPSGYLNVRLDRCPFLIERLTAPPASPIDPAPPKTLVEHTAINPNKAAHIGHLRNAALGDTLGRALRFRGVRVEIQNYIDDTGVQVADVVAGLRVLEGKNLDEIRAIADSTRFDFYCWDLYARVTEWYEADRDRLKVRVATLHDIERGGTEASEIASFVADRIVRCHLDTMARMNVGYDLLTWEGDILRLQFWARAFAVLKERGAVYLQTRGRLAGCWVMKIGGEHPPLDGPREPLSPADGPSVPEMEPGEAPDPEADSASGGENAEDLQEKVIVRSNGTVTYVGKDIAYQFWKFGLLGKDFHYRVFATQPDGRPLWATAPEPTAEEAQHPAFGGAETVYNVIDVRQSYLQKLLSQALAATGYIAQAERSIHFSYEMVALSHATARQLGYRIEPEDEARPFVEVSGRKGLGVKADDLLDALVAKASREVTSRNAGLAAAESARIAEIIAVAAVRYFMVRYSRGKVITFDIDEALSFEGESGPYLQYAVVRANNIFQKLHDREGMGEQDILRALADTPPGELNGEISGHDLWALVLEASRLDEIVEQVLRTLEFSVLAKYAFSLAQMFNAFYHRYPVLNEDRAHVRLWRAAGVSYFRTQLARALELMGILIPPRM